MEALKGLTDKQLRDVISLAQSEMRRRKRIAQKNNVWASNDGLSAVMQASVELLRQ